MSNTKDIQWSENQQAIFAFGSDPKSADKSLIINAVAGSGKTTVIVELANLIADAANDRHQKKGLFLAFNKAIANELNRRLPPTIAAQTTHSFGYSILRSRLAFRVDVNSNKLNAIVKRLDFPTPYRYIITRIVSRAKTFGLGIFEDIEDIESWQQLLDEEATDMPDGLTDAVLIKMAQQTLRESNKNLSTIDFADMLYLPLLLGNKHSWKFKKFPFVILDEAQDISGIQIELLKRITDRIIAVGDVNQAIYAFRGASHTSMELIGKAFNATWLPLDISYRCPLAVITEAQNLVPQIQASPTALLGNVQKTPLSEFDKLADFEEDTLLLCRNNAPLISIALKRLLNKKPFHIYSDFAPALTKYIDTIGATTIKEFTISLKRRHERVLNKLLERNLQQQIEIEMDRYATLIQLAETSDSPSAMKSLIARLAAAKDYNGITMSSIHKAKGLEARHVIFYRDDLAPAPWMKKKLSVQAIRQEYNLRYVAITRSLESLTYVTADSKE